MCTVIVNLLHNNKLYEWILTGISLYYKGLGVCNEERNAGDSA